jgi:hypothetical protein
MGFSLFSDIRIGKMRRWPAAEPPLGVGSAG